MPWPLIPSLYAAFSLSGHVQSYTDLLLLSVTLDNWQIQSKYLILDHSFQLLKMLVL